MKLANSKTSLSQAQTGPNKSTERTKKVLLEHKCETKFSNFVTM